MEEKNKEVLGGQEINKKSIENVGNADQSEYKSVDEQLSALVKATPQLSTTPESYLGTVPFKGISRNVSPYAYTPGINEQEQMAWGQPTIEKIGLAFPRAATTALESIASIPGAVVGLGDWLAHGFDSDEFANAFSNGLLSAVSNTSEDVKERAFSIYTPEEVANGNLWRNLGSSSFWATQGADGVGFLLGAYLTGATPSLLGIGKGVTSGLSKVGVGRTIGQAANIADDVLSASAKSAKQMAKLAKPAAQISEKAGGMIDNLSAVALNTTYEATVEGMDIYNKLIGEGKTPEEASDAAARTFKTNMVLLLPSNMWEQAMMFNSFKKGISAVEKKVLGENRTSRLIDKTIDKAGIAAEAPAFTTVEKLKKFGRALGTGAVTEGFWEEGMQVLTQKMAAEGKSLTNIDDAITGYFDLMFGDDAESKEYWQSVFLGGLLGGGMSSIREASDINKEQGYVSAYHELIKDSWLNRTKVLEDFAKKDDAGNVRYENGNIVLDEAKVLDGAKDYEDKVKELIQMSAAKELGYEELYNNIKTRLDLDFINDFLKVEGGLELFKKFLDSKANSETKSELLRLGVSTDEITSIKEDLIKKAEKLDQIKRFVIDTNSATLNSKIKTDKNNSKYIGDFIDKIANAKTSAELNVWYALDRIEHIKDNLSKYGITVNSDLPLTELISNLKEQLKSSTNKEITPGVKSAIERSINDIGNHIKNYDASNKNLHNLYNNSYLNEAFQDYVKDNKKVEELAAEQASTNATKTATTGLTPELEKVFNEGVKYETIDNIRTPEDLTIEPAINKKQVSHRGVLSIKTPTENVLVRVGRKTENNNLELQIVKQDENGNYIQSDTDKRLAYLNKDGTFVIGNARIHIDFNKDISVVLTPEESRLSLQDRVMADLINHYITPLVTELAEDQEALNYHRKRISNYRDALNEHLKKYQDRLSKEQLELSQIRVGSEYKAVELQTAKRQKSLVMISEGIWVTVAEAKEAVYESEILVNELEASIPSKEAKLNKITDSLNQIRFGDLTPLESITKEIFALSDAIPLFRNDIISHKKEIAHLRALIKKSVALIKGYNTTIASILGIDLNRKEIDLNRHQFIITDKDGKQYEYTRLKTEKGYKYTAREIGTDDVIRIKADHFEAAYDAYYLNQSESIIDEESDLIARYLQENPNAIRDNFVDENARTYKGWFTIRSSEAEVEQYTTIKQSELDTLFELRNKAAAKIAEIRKTIEEEQSTIDEINKERALSLDNQKKFVNLRNTFLTHYKKLIGSFFSISNIIDLELYDKKLTDIGAVEDLLANVFIDEDGEIVKFYEEHAKHPFRGDWHSFLFSSGNQEQTKDNPAVRRWYAFVNSEAYKKDYGVVLVSKKAAKGVFKELIDNNDFYDDNDIKIVIVKNGTMTPVRMTDDGKIGTEGHLIHSSLPEKKTIKINGKDEVRFSFANAVSKYITDNQVDEVEANKKVAEQFDKAFEEFTNYRKSLINSDKIEYLNIEAVSAGAKVKVDKEVEVDVNEAFSRNPINLKYTIEAPDVDEEGNVISKTITRKISGSEGKVRAGFLYALYDNRHVLVKPKTLGETNAVDNIFNLYMYVANHLNTETKEGENAENIRAYLEKVLFHSVKKGSDYRLAFIYSAENDKKTNKIESLLFGGIVVKLSDLAKGKYNNEFKEFLKNKYWSFDKKLVEATDRADFLEYIGSKKGNKYSYSTINHTVKQGGYKHFLFNQKTSKGVVNLKPAIKGETDSTTALIMAEYDNAQFVNQSLQLSLPTEKVIENTKKELKVAVTPKKEIGIPENFTLPNEADELVRFTNNTGTFFLVFNRETNKFGTIDKINSSLTSIANNLATKEQWPMISKAVKDETGKIVVTSNKTTDKFSIEFIKQIKEEEVKETPEIKLKKELKSKFYQLRDKQNTTVVFIDGTKTGLSLAINEVDNDYSILLSDGNFAELTTISHFEQDGKIVLDFNEIKKKYNAPIKETPKGESKKETSTEESEALTIWNALDSDNIKNYYLEKTNGDVNKAAELYYKQISDQDIIARPAVTDDYIKEDINNAISWFRAKFPEVPIEVVEGLINNKYFGGLIKGSKVLISDVAEEGTVYHEAFHVWSLLFKDDLTKLYDETRTRLGNDKLTDKEVNEILAEEFRDFMLQGENYHFNKITERSKENIFRRIWNYILRLLNLKEDEAEELSEVEKAFSELQHQSFTKIINQNTGSFYRIKNLTASETQALIEDINARFFRAIMNDIATDGNIILSLDQKPELIYEIVRNYYKKRLNDNGADWAADQILSNWEELEDKHRLFLTQYKIDIRKRKVKSLNEEDQDEDVVLGRTYSDYVDSMSKDLKEEIPSSIRLLIGAIPNVVVNEDGKLEFIKGKYSTVSNVQFGRMLNVINNKAAKSTTPDELFSNLAELNKKYPAINVLLKLIGFDIESGVTKNVKNLSMTQFILRNQFYNSFANTKNIPIIGVKKLDDSIEYIYPVDEKETSVIKTEWKNNGIALAEANKTPYIKYNKEAGDYVINKDKVLADIGDILSSKDTTKLTKFFRNLGMEINTVTRYTEGDVYISYLRRLSEAMVPVENIKLNDLYAGDIITNQSELNKLIKEHTESFFNDSDLTYLNFNKDKEWSISRNSHLTEVVNRLNSYIRNKPEEVPDSLSHIFNLYSKGSKVLENIEAGNQKEITVSVIKGLKDFNEDGKELKEAKHPDYLAASFDSILNQTVPIIRAGDRGPESTVSLFSINSGANEDVFIEDLFRYLKDEIRTSLALRKLNIGADIENYNKNALELRSFSFIHRLNDSLPTMEKYIKGKTAKNLKDIEKLVDKYVEDHSETLRKVFSTRISEMKMRNLNELLEWKLVIKNEDKPNSFFVKGLSTETLRKYKIDKDVDGTISTAALQKLLTIHAYNQYISTQEQLRLFFGDIAFYKDVTDFHKRITSATSTRTQIANDIPTIEYLNDNLPRLFNPHSQYINKVTFNTITGHSNMYDEDGVKIADGQMFATLDFMRSLLARQGKWNEQEETYQYEMQKLMLDVMKDPELLSILGKTVDSIEDLFKTGVFSKHTGNKVPSSPMYNGKEIDQYNLPQIPNAKNLGVGAIKNDPNLYPHYVNKMSVAAIFPSVLNRDKLKIFLSMLANNIDMFGDATTEKAARISAGKFGEVTDKTPTQQVLYDDFGNQLDIQQEEKRKVTRSTQMDAVIFNDLFNNGELLKEYKDLENIINEHKEIIDTLNKRDFDEVVDALGLKIVDGKYVLDNPERFKAELTDAFVTRIMPDNVIDSISDFLDSSTKTFDILVNKKQMESVLLSIVKNRTIKRKSPGEMLVQESPAMYEELKGYEEGKPMEAILTLPSAWQPWVKTLTYKTFTGLDALNELIKDEKLPKELYTVVANRIPTASINTIEAIRIKKFLPTYLGARIILPGDITIKASSDFDIDKLTTYFNNFRIVDNKQPQYIQYLTNENSTLKERYERFYSKEEREEALANQVFSLFENLPSEERKILTMEEFSKLPIREQNTKKALENRLNEIVWESLLYPARYEDLKRPHESERIRKIAEYIKNNKEKTEFDKLEEKPTFDMLTEWWYNTRKFREFQSSKRLVGFVASNNVVNSRSQKNPITIEEPLFTIFFKGHERGDTKYSSGFIKDDEGELTADNFGQFLVSAVDAVKDPFIFEIMPDIDVYSIYSFLNKFGKDAGVGLKKIAKFLTHPIIVDYLKEMSIIKSVMSDQGEMDKETYKKYYGNKTDVINRVLAKYGATIDDMTFNSYREYLLSSEPEEKASKRKLYRSTLNEKGYKYLTLEDLSKTDNKTALQIFDNFMTYQILAGAFINVNSTLRPDAHGSFPKSINGLESKVGTQEELKENTSIFSGVKEHLENSYIQSSSNIFVEANKMFEWASYIRRNPDLKKLIEDLKFDILSANHTWNRDVESVRNKIEDDLFLYAYLSSRFKEGDAINTANRQKKVYNFFFKGKNSIPNRYIRLKEAGKINTELSKTLRPVISEYVGHRREYRENAYMSTFSKRYGINEENALVSSIEEMLNSKDDELRMFAQDFLDFTLIQSGFSGSPISYTKLLPSSFVAKAMDEYIDKFFKNPSFMEVIKGFKEQFIRNRFADKDVVARVKNNWYTKGEFYFPEKDGKTDARVHRFVGKDTKSLEINKFDTNWNSQYLTVKVLHGDKNYSKENKNKKKQKRMKYDILLLKDSGEVNMKNPKYPKHIYNIIGKLGDQHRMLEYYTARGDQEVDSIINYNNETKENITPTTNISNTSKFIVDKIISGGQTGVDMAGLDIGLELGISIGGTASAGYIQSTSNGKNIKNLELKTKYGLTEGLKTKKQGMYGTYDDIYHARTIKNAQDADGTIWFGNSTSPGGRLTLGDTAQKGKPKPLVNPKTAEEIVDWLTTNNVKVLNVAGNREWTNPGIYEKAKNMLREALSGPIQQSIPFTETAKKTIQYYTGDIIPSENTIFVFGSNPLGINGNTITRTGGAALVAQEKFGVKQGEKMNNRLSDSGKAYGLITVTGPGKKRSLTPEQIVKNIQKLYETAKQNPDKQFKIAYRNTTVRSLNGYTGLEMIDMFNTAGIIPSNIIFSKEWFDTDKLNLKTVTTESSKPEVKTVSETVDNNKDQLSKVTNQLELSELIANFDKLFPNETWRSAEDKEAIMQSINRGDIQISCKI